MKINTNTWNKIRYTFYSLGCNSIVGIFKDSEKKPVESLDVKAGYKVLIVGARTGLDLEFVPVNCEIVAI